MTTIILKRIYQSGIQISIGITLKEGDEIINYGRHICKEFDL